MMVEYFFRGGDKKTPAHLSLEKCAGVKKSLLYIVLRFHRFAER